LRFVLEFSIFKYINKRRIQVSYSRKMEKAQALEEKDKGNEFFKKKDFENAIIHFTNAIDIDPTDPVFFSNR
jgi:hypothetical protein